MERIGFRPPGIGAKLEAPKFNLGGESIKQANFTPLRGGFMERFIENRLQRGVNRLPSLEQSIHKLRKEQEAWTPEREWRMRDAERTAQTRYDQRMQNKAIRWLRKQHEKKDRRELATVRGMIAQIAQDGKGFF